MQAVGLAGGAFFFALAVAYAISRLKFGDSATLIMFDSNEQVSSAATSAAMMNAGRRSVDIEDFFSRVSRRAGRQADARAPT